MQHSFITVESFDVNAVQNYYLVAIGDSQTKGNHSNDISWAYLLESNIGVYVARRGVSGSTLADINARYSEEVSLAAAGANLISHESSEFDSGFGDWIAGDAQAFCLRLQKVFLTLLKSRMETGQGLILNRLLLQ